MMGIKYLELKKITAMHGEEIREAVREVVDGICRGPQTESLRNSMPSIVMPNIAWAAPTDWMRSHCLCAR